MICLKKASTTLNVKAFRKTKGKFRKNTGVKKVVEQKMTLKFGFLIMKCKTLLIISNFFSRQ